MNILALLLALVSLFGGNSDLLDFVSSDAYWQANQVNVSVAAMSAELDQGQSPDVANLIDQLSSDDPQVRTEAKSKLSKMGMAVMAALRQAADSSDPELAGTAKDLISQIGTQSKTIAVRRLMAIRALGELGDPAGEAVLKPLLKSPEMFEADYAAAAIAAIEHRPYVRPAATEAQRVTDAWDLPRFDEGVVQIAGCGGKPTRLETLVGYITPLPGAQQAALVRQFSQELISLAESVGNFRLQVLTVSFAEPLANGQWNAVVVLRGEYDSQAVINALKKANVGYQKINGYTYFQTFLSGLFVPGDDRLVLLMGLNFNRRPMAINAVAGGKETLHDSPDLAPLIAAAGKSDPIWGVLNVTPAFEAQAPWLGAFDTVRMQSTLGDQKLTLSISAVGHDPAAAAKAAADFSASVAKLTNQQRPQMLVPINLRVLQVLQSVQCQADGANASMTARLPMPPFPALPGGQNAAPQP